MEAMKLHFSAALAAAAGLWTGPNMLWLREAVAVWPMRVCAGLAAEAIGFQARPCTSGSPLMSALPNCLHHAPPLQHATQGMQDHLAISNTASQTSLADQYC